MSHQRDRWYVFESVILYPPFPEIMPVHHCTSTKLCYDYGKNGCRGNISIMNHNTSNMRSTMTQSSINFLSEQSPQHNTTNQDIMGKRFFRMVISTLLVFGMTSSAGEIDDYCFHDALCDFGFRCIDETCQPIGYQRHLLGELGDALPASDRQAVTGAEATRSVNSSSAPPKGILKPKRPTSGSTGTPPKGVSVPAAAAAAPAVTKIRFAEEQDVKEFEVDASTRKRGIEKGVTDPKSVADASLMLGLPQDWDPKVQEKNGKETRKKWERQRECIQKTEEVYESWRESNELAIDRSHRTQSIPQDEAARIKKFPKQLEMAKDILIDALAEQNKDLRLTDAVIQNGKMKEKIEAAALILGLPENWDPKVHSGETIDQKEKEINDSLKEKERLGGGIFAVRLYRAKSVLLTAVTEENEYNMEAGCPGAGCSIMS